MSEAVNMHRGSVQGIRIILALYLLLFCARGILAQGCSKENPCATGCCSKDGYCGTTEEHCGAGCVDTCDYKLGCDANNSCTSGCCNTFGFCGLGPDFCGAKVCVAGCDSKSECDPGWGLDWSKSSKCPLNVCCSKYGFCGVTKDFCGDKTVDRGNCPEDGSLKRVVGYFEGWASRRSCNRFWPEKIPGRVYSHINFAFATVDPDSFEIRPAHARDVSLYTRVTTWKQMDPNLKVFIAIGGWTFNDPGPTQTLFSNLAASEDKQKAFFKSLVSFMSTYDFDGIDLDWKYPEAEDRSGRPEDFANFPKFLANLKSTLDKRPGRNGISITLPASYWRLQHFDLQALAKSVSYFNIMSYDLHGTWDKGNEWTGEYLNTHTNLTEIHLAIDLLWRNDIEKDKVVIGLAFYGRSYTVDPSCVEPGCTYLSGGTKGRCSREIGILLNNEIDQIRNSKGVSPILYKDAAVQVLHWDDQWVSYDDADTFLLKTNFARKRCLGGVMVWAMSHDTSDNYYSKALGKVTGYVGPVQFDYDDGTIIDKTNHSQCYWANCGEACPSGWALVPRTDQWKSTEDDYMFDDTSCMGTGSRAFCCPPGNTPTCGWYSFKGGRCEGGYPNGMQEIGSTKTACRYDSYQSACCSLFDNDGRLVDGMMLYGTCRWGPTPQCEAGVCNSAVSTVLGKSGTESGETYCHDTTHRENVFPALQLGEQHYCCNTNAPELRWQNCERVSHVGITTKDMDCVGFCPAGKVKVAMNTYNHGCYNRGYESYCYEPSYYTETTRLSDDVAAFQDALESYGAISTCSTTNLTSRD